MHRHLYRLVVAGRLGPAAAEVFADLRIEPDPAGTALIGELDQSALFGAIARVQRFHLELVEIVRLTEQAAAARRDHDPAESAQERP